MQRRAGFAGAFCIFRAISAAAAGQSASAGACVTVM